MSKKQVHVELSASDQKAGHWPDKLSPGTVVNLKHYSAKGVATTAGYADTPVVLIQVNPTNNLEQPCRSNGGQIGVPILLLGASTTEVNYDQMLFKCTKSVASHDIRFKLLKPNGDSFTVFDKVDLVLEYID